MITSDVLGRWFADQEAQGLTGAAMESFGRRFGESAPIAELRREIASAGASAEAVLAAGVRFMDCAGGLEAALRAMIRACADPFFRPPFRLVSSPIHKGLLLFDDAALSILLAVTTPDTLAAKKIGRTDRTSITFGGQQTAFKFLKGGGATLAFWEAPAIESGFTAAASGRCRAAGTRRIEDGEIVFLDGRRESFVIEHAVSDIVYMQAATPLELAPLAVEYDAATLAFAGASSTDDASSRVQMMASLLRILDRADAAPLLRKAAGHPNFYVRWHVMRELLALDADFALPDLRKMARSDPHPDVRAAAAQTLEAFFVEGELEDELKGALCPA